LSPKARTSSYYQRERNKGRTVSAVLHAVFLLFCLLGLPSFLSPPPPEEPAVISVEILPITGITNVKPSEKPPAEEVKPEDKKTEQKKPSPPVKTSDATPPPPPEPSPAELEKKKAEELKKQKEEEKKKKKEKEKKEADDLAAVLKAVKKTAQEEKKDKKKDDKKENTSPSKAISNQYNPALPMSMSEKDAIMSQIARCWTVPAGARDAQNLVITLNAEYNVDGSLVRVELSGTDKLRAAGDSFFRSAAESAIRAVKQCTPLQSLPPAKYDTWHYMELRFDPKYMLN
jgi:outer membrane biosynthesis protein TonB